MWLSLFMQCFHGYPNGFEPFKLCGYNFLRVSPHPLHPLCPSQFAQFDLMLSMLFGAGYSSRRPACHTKLKSIHSWLGWSFSVVVVVSNNRREREVNVMACAARGRRHQLRKYPMHEQTTHINLRCKQLPAAKLIFVFCPRYGDRLCGLVVRVLDYRSGGPGSIPGTIRKKSSGSGTGSTQPPEYNWGATW
jgi:hypothetical protein